MAGEYGYSFELVDKQVDEPQERLDRQTALTNWLTSSSSSSGAIIAFAEAVTITWTISVDFGIDVFELVKTSLGGNVSRSFTSPSYSALRRG